MTPPHPPTTIRQALQRAVYDLHLIARQLPRDPADPRFDHDDLIPDIRQIVNALSLIMATWEPGATSPGIADPLDAARRAAIQLAAHLYTIDTLAQDTGEQQARRDAERQGW
jgi:hypothetical protein